VAWQGTQHDPTILRTDNGVPKRGGGTLAVIGDLKQMTPRFLMGVSILGYGCSLAVGIGVPIPILNEEILKYTTVTDADIFAAVIDYSDAYPNRKSDIVGEVSYAELKSGHVKLMGKDVPTASLSSYPRAVEIANTLKDWIKKGEFFLTQPVSPLPGVESGVSIKSLKERPVEE
jgi:L-aspartate semialdehyde sulfurtransferase